MTGVKAALHDLSVWARGNLLVIVLLVLGAILLTRFAGWARDRFMAHFGGLIGLWVKDEKVRLGLG